jgi:hypothetical protein
VTETRKLTAILVADVVGYSGLAVADEERTLARPRALLGDLIDPPSPTIAVGSSGRSQAARGSIRSSSAPS